MQLSTTKNTLVLVCQFKKQNLITNFWKPPLKTSCKQIYDNQPFRKVAEIIFSKILKP